jgi:predicted acetyltransferase
MENDELKLVLVQKVKDKDPQGWGFSYIYDIVHKHHQRVVGRCDLRLGDNETLALAGNIGYTIYVPYRGHHYAAEACKLLFKQAKHVGMKEVLITCNTDNPASYRTCELAGCSFVRTQHVPMNHVLYRQGDREKAIFVKTL